MKKLLLALILLTTPAWGQSVTARAGNSISSLGLNSISVAVIPTKTASTLVLESDNSCMTPPAVSDNGNHVWTERAISAFKNSNTGGSRNVTFFDAPNTSTTPIVITANFTACSYPSLTVREIVCPAACVLDGGPLQGGSAASATTTFNIGTLTATAADVLIAATATNNGPGQPGATSGWTALPGTTPAMSEDRAVAAGSYPVTMTTKVAGYVWAGVAVAYKNSGSGPPPPPPPPQTCTGTGSVTATGTVIPPITMLATFTMPGATVGTAYSASVATAAQVSGGTPPYTYAITTGTLPAGLSMNAAGTISGTPTTATTSSFTVKVTDSGGTAIHLKMRSKVRPKP